HGDAVAAQMSHRLFLEADEFPALEADRTRDPRALRREPHERERSHCLAGAGFADHPQALAFVERKRNPIDNAAKPVWSRQVDGEIGCFEQHQPRAFSFGSSASRRPSPSRLRPKTLSAIATPG